MPVGAIRPLPRSNSRPWRVATVSPLKFILSKWKLRVITTFGPVSRWHGRRRNLHSAVELFKPQRRQIGEVPHLACLWISPLASVDDEADFDAAARRQLVEQ